MCFFIVLIYRYQRLKEKQTLIFVYIYFQLKSIMITIVYQSLENYIFKDSTHGIMFVLSHDEIWFYRILFI